MTISVTAQPTDSSSYVHADVTAAAMRLAGKRVGMVMFSTYPFDPRPRRALDALVREGAKVDLICLGSDDAPMREVRADVTVLRIPIRHERGGKFEYAYRYGFFILAATLINALRSLAHGYDLIYVHNMPDILVITSLIPKMLGARVVLDLHDPMPELMTTIFQVEPDSRSVRLLKRFEKWSIARTDLAVTVNVTCKQIFSSRSCREDKIAVVMNSPDDKIFPFCAAQSDDLLTRSSDKPFIIMYHGSLVERNGLDLAVKAMADIREAVPNAELRVFGHKTPYLEHVLESARQKNVSDSIHYFGPRRLEDLVAEIKKCDVGVIPNRQNAFTEINTPTRIFEYLALGKPVIAPSTRGIQDYFSKDSLFFFEAGNSSDLAAQIRYVFSHPHETSDVVRKGQKVFLEHTWERERETLIERVSQLFAVR